MNKPKLSYQRDSRITNSQEYSSVLSNAKRIDLQYLVLYVCPNNVNRARLGMIVAKRKLGSAVLRNRLRRIIKESFRCNQQHLSAVDVVVIAKNTIATAAQANFVEVERILSRGWQKLAAKFLVDKV